MTTVRNQCREFRLTIISKVFLSGLQNHRVFAKLDAGHPLVRLWLPLGRFPTGIQFPWLMLFVVLVSFFFLALWAFSEAGEMAVGSALSYFFGHAVDVREGPVK